MEPLRHVIDGDDMTRLVANIAGAVLLCVVLNGLIFTLVPDAGSGFGADEPGPPGWVIGTVWTVLFAGLGAARWSLGRAQVVTRADAATLRSLRRARGWTAALIVLCASYVFYAILPGSRTLALAGNIATLVVTVHAVRLAWAVDRRAGFLQLPVAAWLTIATVLTVIGDVQHARV